MKNKVVIQSGDTFRVLVNPANIAELVNAGGLLNPDLKAVRKFPPHTWRISRGKLVADIVKLNEHYKSKGCLECVKKVTFLAKLLRRFGW